MNGYKKILSVLSGKFPGSVSSMLHSFMVAAAEKGYTQGEYRSSPEKIARTHIDFARKYGLDGVFIDVDTCLEAGAVGVEVDLPENDPARVITGLSTDLDICIDAMDKDCLLQNDRIKILLDGVNKISREVKGELLIRGNADQGPFSLAMLTVGMTEFFMNLADKAKHEKTRILIDRALEVHLEFHRLMIEAGADITSLGDSSCGPDLISREMYMEFSYPYHVKLAKSLEEEGIQSIIHICGNLDIILEDVVNTGFPAVEVDYKTDINRAQTIMSGSHTILFGPIDPVAGFLNETPERLARKTREILDIFSGRGIVIGAGCALPPDVSEDNLRAFSDAVRQYHE